MFNSRRQTSYDLKPSDQRLTPSCADAHEPLALTSSSQVRPSETDPAQLALRRPQLPHLRAPLQRAGAPLHQPHRQHRRRPARAPWESTRPRENAHPRPPA